MQEDVSQTSESGKQKNFLEGAYPMGNPDTFVAPRRNSIISKIVNVQSKAR